MAAWPEMGFYQCVWRLSIQKEEPGQDCKRIYDDQKSCPLHFFFKESQFPALTVNFSLKSKPLILKIFKQGGILCGAINPKVASAGCRCLHFSPAQDGNSYSLAGKLPPNGESVDVSGILGQVFP